MAQISVNISFEATDMADAETKMAAWTLHEGCTVNTAISQIAPLKDTDDKGKLKEKTA
jgi:hypothetical protein